MKKVHVTPAGGDVSHEENMRMMKRYIQKKKEIEFKINFKTPVK